MPNSTARWERLTTSALRSNALVGMQPQLRQTPPGRSSSTAATERPSWAQRIAATYPPGPVPTTTTSNFWLVAMQTLLRRREESGRFRHPPHHRRHASFTGRPPLAPVIGSGAGAALRAAV